jgi:hypothetical protein
MTNELRQVLDEIAVKLDKLADLNLSIHLVIARLKELRDSSAKLLEQTKEGAA